MIDTIISGDCLDVMRDIPDKSIDMIICDLPYGKTSCTWDIVIPFEPLWEQYKRIAKDRTAIVLFGSQPYSTDLINSNRAYFKYELIWDKDRPSGFALANKRPLQQHENILIFYKNQPTYNPQKTKGIPSANGWNKTKEYSSQPKLPAIKKQYDNNKYPTSIIYQKKNGASTYLHSTQKPVALFEYLIKTYTNKGDLVLDNCIGSGTTAIACLNANRHYVGIELSEKYVEMANNRIEQYKQQQKLAI